MPKPTLLRKTLCAVLLTSVLGTVNAQNSLQSAAGTAIKSNPEVRQKWHEFKASVFERDITWGRNLPTLDVVYGIGDEQRNSPLFRDPAGRRHYDFQTSRITLRQNIFEGFATVEDTRRLEHAAMVRFYETLDLSENIALEAARAHIDVWRYRQLVEYASENYATHRIMYEKIKERAQAGTGRRADLESAAGRLALSESNLLTETSNLHDVSARYQRIVGSLPPATVDTPPSALLTRAMPKDRAESINLSFEKSPALKAAFENILSAARNIKVQKSGYYPKVNAYLEKVDDKDVQGYPGRTDATTVGVTVSWNLFDGLRDISRQRRAAEDKNTAIDLREKVCRSVRQNSAMAFNDYKRLTEQLPFLDQHQLSTDKAREAFRRQFDIGQRTLLDVLDTENEYYTARRNYLNGEADIEVAKVKYLAAAGMLVQTLDLQRLDMTAPRPEAGSEEESLTQCPAEAPPVYQRPRQKDQFILLPEDGGRVGELAIRHQGGDEITLKSAYAAAEVDATASKARQSSAAEVGERYKHLLLDSRVYTLRFAIGSTNVLPASQKVLDSVIADYQKNRAHQVIVIGHADKLGTPAINDKLSEARAKAIRTLLISKGVAAESIATRWSGDREPLPETAGRTKDERNRRVEIRLQ